VWYKNLDRSFFRFVTVHAFDKLTDGQTEFSSLDRVSIPCSAVNTVLYKRLHCSFLHCYPSKTPLYSFMLSASVSGNTKVVNILSAAWRGCRELRAAAGIDKKSYQLGDRCRIRAALA